MENQKNGIWIGLEDKTNDPAYIAATQQEFAGELPIIEALGNETIMETQHNRRDFLKYLGFGLGAATVAASCEIPLKKAVPYVIKPDTIVPGVATYYASTFVNGGDFCPVLVKTREGRPIKIEGNPSSDITRGGTSARAQATVLSLYDTNRYQSPQKNNGGNWNAISWADLDKELKSKLASANNIRILTGTVMSPTAKRAIEEFIAKFPSTKVVSYDPVSSAAILLANEKCFGDKVIPNYKFQNADVIVSFGADFLGTWISPIEYAANYVTNRRLTDLASPKMSKHIQVESHMSLTGSNADNRILVKPSEQGAAIVALYNEVAKLAGGEGVASLPLNDKATKAFKKVAADLVAARGRSLVVAASNDINEQVLVNKINDLLGSYGTTIDFAEASLQRQGVDSDVQSLLAEMKGGSVGTLLVFGANPAYELPNGKAFAEAMAKVKTKISFAVTQDETTALCDYIAPNHHLLESWGDVEAKRGQYGLVQPTIAPLFNTRQAELSLLTWAESANLDTTSAQPYFDYLKKGWQENQFGKQSNYATFQSFWDNMLHDGVFTVAQAPKSVAFAGNVAEAAAKIKKPANSELEISFYETVNIGGGQYADNPWLQEMPDPVMRTVWGNNLAIPVSYEGGRSFKTLNNLKNFMRDADQADLTIGGLTLRVTAVPQFGQMQGTVALALGYGRREVGFAGRKVGHDVHPALSINADGLTQYYSTNVQLSGKTGQDPEFACVQFHHSMGLKDEKTGINADERALAFIPDFNADGFQGALTKRSILYQSSLKEVGELVDHIKEKRAEAQKLNAFSLYPGFDDKYKNGHHWGMHIDLNACIGCGACTVACMSENNVPIVGKKEVRRHHEMTWLRIDRYFYGDLENPNTVYQPMMCQHCDNAPCENVCPVNATNHSTEGLNQMAYNRCVGTRYCANNCPYKVRRFNWYDYTTADLFPANEIPVNGEAMRFGADNLTRMVLNPDVTVRSRGVIEKCSFCTQRIQEGKLTAKKEGRTLRDADVKTACQTACPTGAIVFGDQNNQQGEMSKRSALPLSYIVLEETNVASSVRYSAKVVNKDEALG
jgi:MoCo/4Fe-4S cofactor protein with predicted Tat translocation signal